MRRLLFVAAITAVASPLPAQRYIRVNQVGYLPDAPKIAVVCALDTNGVSEFTVTATATAGEPQRTRRALRKTAAKAGAFGPCVQTYRLDFSDVKTAGIYLLEAPGAEAVKVRVGADVWDGGADTLLYYMRQQRSGWNPMFRDSVHRFDGNLVDDSGRVVRRVDVGGGWADASDYLQYVTTSANAAYVMLAAYRDHPAAFADKFDARGGPGGNGIPDVLDEARHGLEWLSRMFPSDSEMFNQLGDDRDHAFFDLILDDSSDYGWGRGRERVVYECSPRPQGLFAGKNRSTGKASTAGKYASAFAIGSQLFARDSAFARMLRMKASAAYRIGMASPGVCQTAPGRSPYFYEEDNYADDMELAAAQLFSLTRDSAYLIQTREFARMEPVTPWMGKDTANHYQWFPWHNNGHYELWRGGKTDDKRTAADFYRQGLEAVVARASNGFRIGIPFIWCSNNLMTSFATQGLLYRRMTGDTRFREYEQAAIDWLFGANPWGVSMVIGYPNGGNWAHDPHSVHAFRFGPDFLLGGLLDGPVYRSIYQNLRGIRLLQPDEYERFNTGFIVYHDDMGDYSTNEPIMDGTASLTYLLAALASGKR